MADAKVQIGDSADFLEGTSVTTPAGANLFREGVVISDGTDPAARAKITNTSPAADAYGLAVRVVGGDQTTGNASLSSIDGKLPDESGAWGYNAGVSGTVTVAANKRILAITATAGALVGATMTINGGQTITIPAGTSITITPRANLTAPTLVFTSTASYFVEFIE